MTREQFKLRLLGESPKYVPRAYFIPLGSQTDPSYAMTGAQIVSNSLRGLPVSSPINLEFNGMSQDQVTPFDKPIKERMDVIDYTRKKLKETDDITQRAYNEMIKEIDNSKKEEQ